MPVELPYGKSFPVQDRDHPAAVRGVIIIGGRGAGGDGGDGGDGGEGGDGPSPNRRGRITIIEDNPRGPSVTFGFHTKNLKQKKFRLRDDGEQVFSDPRAGTYTVAQDKKHGWILDRIVCTDPTKNTKISLGARRAAIKLKDGEHVVCAFTNKKK